MRDVYFDHAATTGVDPRVLEKMLPFLGDEYGNPSEVHRRGRRARAAVDEARAQVAAALGADEREIVFTGGGSESDTLALVGSAQTQEPAHLIVSGVEHPAVMEAARHLQKHAGWEVSVAPVDAGGRVDVEAYAAAFRPDTRIASVMLANNVVGTLQPVAELARIAHQHGAVFHTDAVQAVGAVPVDVRELDVDMLALSGHKLYAPKGVGALYVRRGTKLRPVIHGGGQERGLRSGTENVPGIVGSRRGGPAGRRGAPGGIATPDGHAGPADRRRAVGDRRGRPAGSPRRPSARQRLLHHPLHRGRVDGAQA